MADFVVDASVAVKWGLKEPDSAAARRLLVHRLLAPRLLYYECANALWRQVRRGVLTSAQARTSLAFIVGPPLIWVTPPFDDVLNLSIEIDHPAYDCAYLLIAEREDLPLVTADRRLRNKVRSWPRLERRVLGLDEVA